MADYPAIPLWTDAYLADTRHLDAEMHGAYLLLIMEAWRRPKCDLPGDDAFLARAAACTPERWEAIKKTVMAFWKYDGRRKTWTQKRLISERDYVATKSKSQRDKAIKRWNKTKPDDATAIPQQSHGNAPTPTPTYSVAKATAADAPIDPAKVMFDSGIGLLSSAGVPEARARSMIGKWRKDHGTEAVISALGRAQREGPVDPVPFIEGALRFERGRTSEPRIGDTRQRDGFTEEWRGIDGWMRIRQ